MDQSNQRTNISRRGFLASLASATFIAAFPSIANAQTMASANVSNDTSKGEQAKALWEEAVRKAKQEGAEVHENLIPGPQALTRALKTGVATMPCVIKLAPTQVDAVATYNTSGNNITTVQNAWIQANPGSVSNLTYSYTKLDQGQTLCVSYSCQIKPLTQIATACHFYAEFYSNGSGWMNGGPVS